MLDSLKKLFGSKSTNHETNGQHSINELHLAASVVMVEAARMDDNFDDREYSTITVSYTHLTLPTIYSV